MNRVIDDKIYWINSEDGYLLKDEALTTNPNESVQSTRYLTFFDDKFSQAKTAAACGYAMGASYFLNASGCSGDREAFINFVQTYYQFTATVNLPEGGGPFYQIHKATHVEIKIWGSKRNGLCKWSEYYFTRFDYP